MAGFTGLDCGLLRLLSRVLSTISFSRTERQPIKKAARGGPFSYHDHFLFVIQKRCRTSKVARWLASPAARPCGYRMIGGRVAVLFQQHWNQRAFCLLGEGKHFVLHINPDEVTQLDL